MSDSPFNKPSDSDGLGPKVTDFEGALCVFTYRGEGVKMTKKYGEKPYVEVDVDCIEGVPAGTKSKMPPQSYGEDFAVLEDQTGKQANKILIFQGFLRGAFRGRREGDMVLGRVVVEGKVTSVSKNDQDLKASFVLADADEAETAKAVAFLNKKAASKLAAPSAPAQAAPAPAEPVGEPQF